MSETRLPTPLVLAAVSAMISIGLIAFYTGFGGTDPEPESRRRTRVVVDDHSAEAAAESFLDAWRKREHNVAARLSLGAALAQVRAREQRDAAMTQAERELRKEVWDAMASTRLRLILRDSERLENGDLLLAGIAEGTFIERDYAREVEFEVRDTNGVNQTAGYRVIRVRFGEILTELPPALRFER